MSIRVVRATDLVRVPWKNGGGTTAEVAAFPEEAGFDGFGWRISMADVAADGPFSLFPGIDRTLIVVDGNGIVLDVDGVRARLDSASPQLSFPGDRPTAGTLIAGPIRDLNIMTRRRAFSHRARIVDVAEAVDVENHADVTLITALEDGLTITSGAKIWSLRRLDTLVGTSERDRIRLSGPAKAVVIAIMAKPAGVSHEPASDALGPIRPPDSSSG